MVSRAPAAAAAALCALLLVSAIAGQEVTLDDDARTGQKKTRDEDVSRDAFELAASKGYEVEEHRVTTRDGYILKMIRIVGSPNRNSGVLPSLVFGCEARARKKGSKKLSLSPLSLSSRRVGTDPPRVFLPSSPFSSPLMANVLRCAQPSKAPARGRGKSPPCFFSTVSSIRPRRG